MRITKYILLLALIIPILIVHADAPSLALPRCTQAQHDSYKVQGPNGQWYQTWHPQIDPYYGCYFDHEHGSNPALFQAGVWWQAGSGYWPLFGYSAGLMGMSEGHAGFKAYVLRYGGKRILLVQHQGTANAPLAACTRMHTLDIAILDEATGTLELDEHGMADFGASVENTSGTPLTPPLCPDQGSIVSTGVRQLPVAPDSVGYEPWRTDIVTGTLDARLTFNTLNPQTACANRSCTAALARSDVGGIARGTLRSLTIEWFHFGSWSLPHAVCVAYGMDYIYDCTEQAHDEEFYRRMPFVTGSN